ncbi:uncharacterized protein BDR25DRAFT_356354 [Lindgomyces ingoldianus]|uniref:Uncharacterized protein n=1 Tax=Lindgomyces ingoldianus TaxID=673940 RepID=A0ACB6QRR1_9PLEO|nr:uncharacterized protein BDR25DRAFT_356354 [Lindgomyces ingoldianus]KAF2469621.1 hypothetical protein BDR25DRAFT_356354 [Lindgomyces ingoldianus]
MSYLTSTSSSSQSFPEISTIHHGPSKIKADRIGGDPGLFGFKPTLGKVQFLLHGHRLVNERFYKAEMALTYDGYIYYSVRKINCWLIIRTFLVVLAQWYRAPSLHCKDKNYFLQYTNVDRLVLSPKYLDELRMGSAAKLNASFTSTVNRMIFVEEGLPKVYQGSSLRICHKSCVAVMTKEYSSYSAHKLLVSLNWSVSSFFFVGPSLSRNKEWRKLFSDLQPAIISVIIWLTSMPEVLRRILGPVITLTKRLKSVHAAVRRHLFPPGQKINDAKDPSILHHYLTASKTRVEKHVVAKCFADLPSKYTQYIDGLRNEVEEVLAANGGHGTQRPPRSSGEWISIVSFDGLVLAKMKFSDETILLERTVHQFSKISIGIGVLTGAYTWEVGLFILNYDIKFPDGQTQRPPNSYMDAGIMPNEKQDIYIENWGTI